MKYFIRIIPLLFTAIGAFFLSWQMNALVIFILLSIVLVFNHKLLKQAIINIFSLFIFTLPIILIRFFTIQEGKIWNIGFISIYSEAIAQNISMTLKVFILSLISFIFFKIAIDEKDLKNWQKSNYITNVFLKSLQIYQDIIRRSVRIFRELKKTKKNIVQTIDKLYLDSTGRKTEKES